MDINIHGNFHVTNHIKDYFEKKVKKFDKLFSEPVTLHANILHEGNGYTVETSLIAGKKTFHLKETGKQPLEAVDKVIDKLDVKVHKTKEIKSEHKRKRLNESFYEDYEEDLGEESVEIKYINLKPISINEARMIMEEKRYDFYPFFNEETGEFNVIYKKRNGYGLYIQNKK